MKPEEIDRLFREQLEQLDEVPGLEWSSDAAWNKLSAQNGGWPNWGTALLSTSVILIGCYIVYRLFTTTNEPLTQAVNKSAAIIETEQIDSSIHTQELKQEEPEIKSLSPNKITLVTDSIKKTVVTDSVSLLPEYSDTINYNGSLKVYNRYPLRYASGKQVYMMPMPHITFLQLKVNNSFNFSNLSKSIWAQKNAGNNFYYFYETDKYYSPAMYPNYDPDFMNNNTYIHTNFNK